MFLRLTLSLVLLVLALGPTPATPAPAAPQAVPAGFADQLVVNVSAPTALAFLPDGRLLAASQTGQLRLWNGVSLTTALDFTTAWPQRRICTDFERGLLGIAIDPAFTSTNHIYLFYTAVVTPSAVSSCSTSAGGGRNTWNVVNRVSRFTLSGNSVLTPSELIVMDNMPSWGGNHNGGDIHFGNDGYLYISIGDGGTDYDGSGGSAGSNNAARDQHILLGKVLRITGTGGVPADNPFVGDPLADRCYDPAGNTSGRTTPGRKCQETFAWGLRNPFRIAFDPNTPLTQTRFYINDVGQNVREEIALGVPGGDQGWNCFEGTRVNSTTGPCAGVLFANTIAPTFEYTHGAVPVPGTSTTGCNAITGGAFVPANAGWPAPFANAYLFADGICNTIFAMPTASGLGRNALSATVLADGLNYPVHLAFGPYAGGQALYYTNYSAGQVRRVIYNRPSAAFTATPTTGPAPLSVAFDASASTDPLNGSLTYAWDFGTGASLLTTTAQVTYTYSTPGTFTATLVVSNSVTTSAPASQSLVVGNTPPTASIASVSQAVNLSVGQAVTLTGTGLDAQDGALTDMALAWQARLWHIYEGSTHWHPLSAGFGPTFTVDFPAPEDLSATVYSYVEVLFTATDTLNATHTVTTTLQARRVPVSVVSAPPGLQIQVNEVQASAPYTLTSWSGFELHVSAPSPQWLNATPHYTVTAPFATLTGDQPVTLTVTFAPGSALWLPLVRR